MLLRRLVRPDDDSSYVYVRFPTFRYYRTGLIVGRVLSQVPGWSVLAAFFRDAFKVKRLGVASAGSGFLRSCAGF